MRTRGEGGEGNGEGWLCRAVLHFSRARAEHLRCKILNPSASAISPTSSAGRRIEEGGREIKIEKVEEGAIHRRGRKGVGSCPPEGEGGYGEAALRRALSKFTFKCKSAECH